jgi:acyl-CoA dehydrogenase
MSNGRSPKIPPTAAPTTLLTCSFLRCPKIFATCRPTGSPDSHLPGDCYRSPSTGAGRKEVCSAAAPGVIFHSPNSKGIDVDFELSPRAAALRDKLVAFMEEVVYPAEVVYRQQMREAGDPHAHPQIIEDLKTEARARGLWNLFLPHATEWTEGLSNVDYAPLAEISGRSHLAPEAMNCSAPDTGNMEILTMFGTPEQKEQWLRPLLEGEIRSCFAMTEPEVASSDATNIQCSIRRDGGDYVINGRKWWISGAASSRCKVAILMGKTNPDAPPHLQQSMILVPMDTPGLTVVRSLPVFGFHDREGHCELIFDNVRVPASNLLGEEGAGFAIAQARLGPGRIHHCMRCLGAAERALELMCRRVRSRVAFGRPLADQGVIQQWIADSRIEIDQARLLTLYAAWLMDTVGNKGARTEISAIKVAAPNVALKVIDRAIQAHGGGGVSDDFPLASMYAGIRTLRIADGPDEVHRMVIARRELRKYEGTPAGAGESPTSGDLGVAR